MAHTEQAEALAERLIAAVPKLGAREQRIGLGLLRTLVQGRPASDDAVAVAAGAAESEVRDAMGVWPGVFGGDHGRVVGFMGLSVVEFGEHRVEVDGRRLTAWCAWDTLFLPGLLGRTARVSSRCPVTGEAISLTVAADGPNGPHPAGTVLSFLAPERPFDADVVRSFCHFAHFFASEGAAQEWIAEHPGTFTLSIEDGFELGRVTNAATFGAALGGAAGGA